jgi:hypothetical protein
MWTKPNDDQERFTVPSMVRGPDVMMMPRSG